MGKSPSFVEFFRPSAEAVLLVCVLGLAVGFAWLAQGGAS